MPADRFHDPWIVHGTPSGPLLVVDVGAEHYRPLSLLTFLGNRLRVAAEWVTSLSLLLCPFELSYELVPCPSDCPMGSRSSLGLLVVADDMVRL